jgi:glutaredoxin-related protein
VICFSFSSADVDFWVNGGWDQPNCGITINILSVLQTENVKDIQCKNYST